MEIPTEFEWLLLYLKSLINQLAVAEKPEAGCKPLT